MKHLKYSDIALVPQYSDCRSRADNSTSVYLFDRQFKLPIIPANMKSVINIDLAKWMSNNDYFYIMHRFDIDILKFVIKGNEEQWKNISISLGVKEHDEKIIEYIREEKLRVDFITIDIAHGHSSSMKKMINFIKSELNGPIIIAGNVATPDAVADLSSWGADIVKVGVGQGSPCTTKYKTGFTMPMFSCVRNCSRVSFDKENGFMTSIASISEDFDIPDRIPIIADGGIEHNGDIAKALCVGACMVMAGSVFASCTDSPSVSSVINNVFHKAYFGSASLENKGHNNNIEGKLTNIISNGMTYEKKLDEIKQDLQSSISYSGGNNLNSLYNTNYIEV